MKRIDATRCISKTLRDEAVVVSLGHPACDLFAAGDRPLNFYTWGSMGLTSSIALGLALALPDRRIVALDGDGSLLMNLGSLATIGMCLPPNLLIIVEVGIEDPAEQLRRHAGTRVGQGDARKHPRRQAAGVVRPDHDPAHGRREHTAGEAACDRHLCFWIQASVNAAPQSNSSTGNLSFRPFEASKSNSSKTRAGTILVTKPSRFSRMSRSLLLKSRSVSHLAKGGTKPLFFL
jgi:hypothetical protein